MICWMSFLLVGGIVIEWFVYIFTNLLICDDAMYILFYNGLLDYYLHVKAADRFSMQTPTPRSFT
jgi:hypothetical protein